MLLCAQEEQGAREPGRHCVHLSPGLQAHDVARWIPSSDLWTATHLLQLCGDSSNHRTNGGTILNDFFFVVLACSHLPNDSDLRPRAGPSAVKHSVADAKSCSRIFCQSWLGICEQAAMLLRTTCQPRRLTSSKQQHPPAAVVLLGSLGGEPKYASLTGQYVRVLSIRVTER